MLRAAGRRLLGRSSQGEPLFDKVLIANRGEIACRIIKTCRRLGVKTVAVYSQADKNSLHVQMADEAYCVGPAPSIESYLRIENIMDAVHKSGAQAVHPGYGFLSENFLFCDALDKAGVEFVGPPVSAMKALGDKIESKLLAKSLGVSVVPGQDGEIETEKQLLQACKDIGYPIMLKPSAGGGGKGMHVVHNDTEAKRMFKLAKAEAQSSFGDDRMLMERFVSGPRHIEIQLIGDKHGNVVALSERECSVQRRNQKVLEESPSPFVIDQGPDFRKKMFDQAVALAKHVKYHSAGTVEMMVDGVNKDFFFLEMNTRLQVEHPVTEMVTGFDLVEQMLRVAAGHKLGFSQSDVQIQGHSTEARVYAEDPLEDFVPTVGQLTRYHEPSGDGIRVDSGVCEGDRISVYYDPMIAKLITYAPPQSVDGEVTREGLHAARKESIRMLASAADEFVIDGVKNNLNIIRAMCDNERYISGELTTKFLPEEYPTGFHGYPYTPTDIRALAHGMAAHRVLLETARYEASAKHSGVHAPAPPARLVVEAYGWRFVLLVVQASSSPGEEVPRAGNGAGFFDIVEVAVQAPEGEAEGDAKAGAGLTPLTDEVRGMLSASEVEFTELALRVSMSAAAEAARSGGPDGQMSPEKAVRARVYARAELRQVVFATSICGETLSFQLPMDPEERKLNYFAPIRAGSAGLLGMGSQKVLFKGTTMTAAVRTAGEALAAEIVPPPREPVPGPEMLSPMSGVLVDIVKKPGERVAVGDAVVVLEAMKMRNEINAEVAGVVKSIPVELKDVVKEDDILFVIEPDTKPEGK